MIGPLTTSAIAVTLPPGPAARSESPAPQVPGLRPPTGTASPADPRTQGDDPARRAENKSDTTEAIEARRAQDEPLPQTRLSIVYHEDAGLFVSRSVERRSGEVVAQFPAEQALRRIAAAVEDQRRQFEERRLDLFA